MNFFFKTNLPFPWIYFDERGKLPIVSGVYLILDGKDCIRYVGKAQSIKDRLSGKNHHRYKDFMSIGCKKIAFLMTPLVTTFDKDFSDDLIDLENKIIDKYKPDLNKSIARDESSSKLNLIPNDIDIIDNLFESYSNEFKKYLEKNKKIKSTGTLLDEENATNLFIQICIIYILQDLAIMKKLHN